MRIILVAVALSALVLGNARELNADTLHVQGSQCSNCLFALRLVDDVLSDPEVTLSLVDLFQHRVCRLIGGGEQCHNIAEGFIPVTIDWLRSPATAQNFCTVAGACDSKDPALVEAQRKAQAAALRDTSQCAYCQLFVFQAQRMLNDTAVLAKINETILQACSLLPKEFSGACVDFVNQYEPLVIAILTHTSPKDVCTMIGICGQQALLVKGMPVELPSTKAFSTHIYNAHVLQQQQHKVRHIQAGRADGQHVKGFGDSCDMCKLAVIEAHTLVSNPAIQQSLINYTKTMCDSFPSFADTCKLYVDMYAPVAFTMLDQYLVPDVLCAQIGVCNKTAPAMPLFTATRTNRKTIPALPVDQRDTSSGAAMVNKLVDGLVNWLAAGLQQPEPRVL